MKKMLLLMIITLLFGCNNYEKEINYCENPDDCSIKNSKNVQSCDDLEELNIEQCKINY